MSIERHPNINAAAFTLSVLAAYSKYLRGDAEKDKEAAFDMIKEDVAMFVVKVSERLDDHYGAVRSPQKQKEG